MNALVLAGGARDEVSAKIAGAANKAFVPIGGRTLVERTLAALRGVPAIGRIIVVAPRVSHGEAALALADERRSDGKRISDSLRAGLVGAPPDELLLVAASDLPLLTRASIEEFIALALARDADLTYACLGEEAHIARFPEAPHTWARLREGRFCGGGLIALRPRIMPSLELFLERLGAARKNPLALASIFGLGTLARYVVAELTIPAAEKRASELLGAPVAAAVCTHAEIAFNVDRGTDVALAEKYVAELADHEGVF
jgi:molybdopterin-guanine dinucleotide biosynthesis protein A